MLALNTTPFPAASARLPDVSLRQTDDQVRAVFAHIMEFHELFFCHPFAAVLQLLQVLVPVAQGVCTIGTGAADDEFP